MKKLFLSLVLAASTMPAATLGFTCLVNNSGTCPTNVAPNISLGINDLGGGTVQFLFGNNLPVGGGIITTVYIDEGTTADFFSSFSVNPTTGVNFQAPGTSGVLPGGNSSPYLFTTNHSADRATKGGLNNGVNPGEALDFRGTLNAGITFGDLIAGLATSPTDLNGLRVALHVQSLPGGFSEGLISMGDTAPVPEPATVALTVAGLGLLAVRRLRS